MMFEQKIERALNGLPNSFRPRCPICASTLFFNGGRWVCKFCPYVTREIAGEWKL